MTYRRQSVTTAAGVTLKGYVLNGGSIQDILKAAALAALTEKEDAR